MSNSNVEVCESVENKGVRERGVVEAMDPGAISSTNWGVMALWCNCVRTYKSIYHGWYSIQKLTGNARAVKYSNAHSVRTDLLEIKFKHRNHKLHLKGSCSLYELALKSYFKASPHRTGNQIH